MVTTIGIVGLICFALSAAPTLFEALRTGKATVVWTTLILWIVGEAATLFYVWVTNWDIILLANYIANLLMLLVILMYKLFPQKQGLSIFVGLQSKKTSDLDDRGES